MSGDKQIHLSGAGNRRITRGKKRSLDRWGKRCRKIQTRERTQGFISEYGGCHMFWNAHESIRGYKSGGTGSA